MVGLLWPLPRPTTADAAVSWRGQPAVCLDVAQTLGSDPVSVWVL